MIEPRGGKHAYVLFGVAIREEGAVRHIHCSTMFTAADSDDEAYGIGMRAVHRLHPAGGGWLSHTVHHYRIDGIAWVGRLDPADLAPVKDGIAAERGDCE